MPVARVGFSATYGGEITVINAGEIFAAGHELVQRHPDAFAPDAPLRAGRVRRLAGRRGTGPGTAPSASAPARPRPRKPDVVDDRETPSLRAAASPITLVLSRSARESIREELRYSREMLDDYSLETAGWLFGQRQRDGSYGVALATSLGRDGRRKPGAVQLGYSEVERIVRDLQLAANDEMRFLFAWHTHPDGDGSPSTADRQNALAALDWTDLRPAPFAVSLILTPDRIRGWSAPRFHAWTTRRRDSGLRRAVTEPATIKVSGS